MKLGRLTLLLVLALASSCTNVPATDACIPPPATEVAAPSAIEMSLDPNPVKAGTSATLSVDPNGEFAGRLIGIGAELQCWDGSEWKPLFLLTREKPLLPPSTIPVVPGQTTVVPALGVTLPDSSRILIPDVPTGVYRIENQLEDSHPVIGFVIVQIVK